MPGYYQVGGEEEKLNWTERGEDGGGPYSVVRCLVLTGSMFVLYHNIHDIQKVYYGGSRDKKFN